MSKIQRYGGNFPPFARDFQSQERTSFGTEDVGENSLDGNINADWLRGWGIISPTEFPPIQYFNALGFTLSQTLAYLHQQGVPEWNSAQEYFEGSVTQKGGDLYISQVGTDGSPNTGNDPETDDGTNWAPVSTGGSSTGPGVAPLSATDSATDKYQVDIGGDWSVGDVYTINFGSGNGTTNPELENTGGTPAGSIRLLSREGLEIPHASLKGVQRVEYDGTHYRALTLEVEYIAFYNGQSVGDYSIGRARSRDGIRYGRDTPENVPFFDSALNDGSAKQYDDSILACSPVMVGDEMYLYFEGYDGTRYNIFLMVLDRQGRLQHVIEHPVKENTTGDEAHTVRRPRVIYTPGGSPAFQMWYSSSDVGQEGKFIRYATSDDGIAWTVQGTVLNLGAAGSFDDTFLTCDRVVFVDGTYYIFYGGNDGSKWQGGYATSTSPGTGFTKGNGGAPILVSGGANELPVSADVTGGTKTISFSSGALAFDAGAIVAIYGSTDASNVLNEIESVDSDTQITVKYPVYGTYTTASSTKVSQINSNSVDPVEVWFDGTEWHCLATVFQFISGRNRESTMYAKTSDLDTGFNWQYGVWPLPMNFKRGVWDNYSAENINRIPVLR